MLTRPAEGTKAEIKTVIYPVTALAMDAPEDVSIREAA
jgi:hypothetical protein